MTDWVRLWHDMPTDPKWRVIARKSGQSISTVIAVFNFVLVNASANANERGRTHNLHAEDIAAALDVDEADIVSVVDAMQGKVINNGYLTGWEKRQPKREDSSAERARAWRERKRTHENASERPETETDIYKEEVRKREVSLPSEAPSRAPRTGARLPDDWEPDAETIQWTSESGFPMSRLPIEIPKFRDYWSSQPGAKGRKTSWPATWRNWIRRAMETVPQTGPPDIATALAATRAKMQAVDAAMFSQFDTQDTEECLSPMEVRQVPRLVTN